MRPGLRCRSSPSLVAAASCCRAHGGRGLCGALLLLARTVGCLLRTRHARNVTAAAVARKDRASRGAPVLSLCGVRRVKAAHRAGGRLGVLWAPRAAGGVCGAAHATLAAGHESALAWLHGSHSSWRLESLFDPPRQTGVTWSSVSGRSVRWQQLHFLPSRRTRAALRRRRSWPERFRLIASRPGTCVSDDRTR